MMSALLFWRGLFVGPRTGRRFAMTLAAFVLFMVGFGLFLHVTENASASLRDGASAARYRCAEDIGIVPVVIPELEFRNVERQVFRAHLVERAHDAALINLPKIDAMAWDIC
jgi:hypothetical protein